MHEESPILGSRIDMPSFSSDSYGITKLGLYYNIYPVRFNLVLSLAFDSDSPEVL